jgi:hypothetical protein
MSDVVIFRTVIAFSVQRNDCISIPGFLVLNISVAFRHHPERVPAVPKFGIETGETWLKQSKIPPE